MDTLNNNIPRILERRYTDLLDPEATEQIAAAMMRSLPPAIRVNTLKTNVSEAMRDWQEWYGWSLQQVPWCREGWQVTQNVENLSWTVEHRMGFYYIQDAASMLPVEMFSFDEGEVPIVLDMTAAPGGKTTHLISRLDDKGLVIANDINWQRIRSLQGNLERWGTVSAVTTRHPGERFGNWFPELFDKVLVDAPCSGEALVTAEGHESKLVSSQMRHALQKRQINLLDSAFQAVRPGGQVVYATCTMAPEENEAVLDALLDLYPRQAVIEPVEDLLTKPATGITQYETHEYKSAVRHAVRLWPHLYDTAGFFAALIRKRDSVDIQPDTPPKHSLDEAGYERMTRQEQGDAIASALDTYGLDLEVVIERHNLILLKQKRLVYGVPQLWLSRFMEFPFFTAGMLLGEHRRKGFIPSHELISRFYPYFTRQRFTIDVDDEQLKSWLAGRNLQGVQLPASSSGVILLEDHKHRFLGRGKVRDNQIVNMLPRWR